MRILVTGGAGYIGSVTTAHLLDRGHDVRVLDDLSTGHRPAVPSAAQLVVGRIQDAAVLRRALDAVDAVVHFASLSLVGESMQQPRHYFRENVGAAIALLDGMDVAGVSRIVFSSTAAVYGEPAVDVIDEDVALRPVNPYGHSKVMIERVLAEEARANGLSAMALRYFNACGADGPRGEHHDPETHLIPRVCRTLLGTLDGEFRVFGDDHPTPDGTPVRDYVHVLDLATAHALAIEALGEPGFEALNLGTGHGASVKEVLAAARTVTGHDIPLEVGPRRAGDPPKLVASNARARARLGWEPSASSMERILADAWAWHQAHPEGYVEG